MGSRPPVDFEGDCSRACACAMFQKETASSRKRPKETFCNFNRCVEPVLGL
jgi:hypothetical protein